MLLGALAPLCEGRVDSLVLRTEKEGVEELALTEIRKAIYPTNAIESVNMRSKSPRTEARFQATSRLCSFLSKHQSKRDHADS